MVGRATSVQEAFSVNDLHYYRRHIKTCKRRSRGRKELSCNCPLWVDGTLNGKRYNRALGTRNLARAAAIIEKIQAPDYREPKPMADAIAEFQASRQDLGDGTRRNYRRVLGNLAAVAKAHGVTAMTQVEVELIDHYREARPIGGNTRGKELEALRVFFRFAVARKWIKENPAAAVKAPKIKPTEKEPYTPDDISQFLAATEKLGRTPYERLRSRALVLLLRYTALRISDVALLEVPACATAKSLYAPPRTPNRSSCLCRRFCSTLWSVSPGRSVRPKASTGISFGAETAAGERPSAMQKER
jgi:hypothetical protein